MPDKLIALLVRFLEQKIMA